MTKVPCIEDENEFLKNTVRRLLVEVAELKEELSKFQPICDI